MVVQPQNSTFNIFNYLAIFNHHSVRISPFCFKHGNIETSLQGDTVTHGLTGRGSCCQIAGIVSGEWWLTNLNGNISVFSYPSRITLG